MGALLQCGSGAQHSQFSTGFRADTTSPDFLSNNPVLSDEYDDIFPDENITPFPDWKYQGMGFAVLRRFFHFVVHCLSLLPAGEHDKI